ncbi:MAG: Rieske (2Fe-2S) protein [Flavobacteriales bacterium]|nr:Rieske (2Fe-2S) protein [Flavobacteriales bacterium]
MDRRGFLRSSCQACAAIALAPALVSMESCASGSKMLAVENGMLTVPMDTMGNGNTAIVSGQGLANKLMIVKRADGTYTALELLCPHKQGPLKEVTGGLECDWHHSRFDLEGKVLGGPAKQDLKTYPVGSDGKNLLVKVV